VATFPLGLFYLCGSSSGNQLIARRSVKNCPCSVSSLYVAFVRQAATCVSHLCLTAAVAETVGRRSLSGTAPLSPMCPSPSPLGTGYWRRGGECCLRSWQFLSQSRNSPHFTKAECSLPCSQYPAKLSLSLPRWIQSTQIRSISWRTILISSHPRLDIPSGLLPSGFPTKWSTRLESTSDLVGQKGENATILIFFKKLTITKVTNKLSLCTPWRRTRRVQV